MQIPAGMKVLLRKPSFFLEPDVSPEEKTTDSLELQQKTGVSLPCKEDEQNKDDLKQNIPLKAWSSEKCETPGSFFKEVGRSRATDNLGVGTPKL